MRVRHRVRVQARGDESGEVRHVHPEQGAHLVGDRTERGEVEGARVGGPAGDDDLRLVLDGGRRTSSMSMVEVSGFTPYATMS